MDSVSMELIRKLSIAVGRFPMETVQRGTSSQPNTHGHPSCIQQLFKDNTQPWTQLLRS